MEHIKEPNVFSLCIGIADMKMKALSCSEMLQFTFNSKPCYNTEYSSLHNLALLKLNFVCVR